MRILIGNDDGIDSPGLALLRNAAERLTGDVWIVAPERKWTAASHQLSFDQDLELVQREERAYTCSGAPADCTVAAMILVFDDAPLPDLVLSGINDGLNAGEDAIYSGTLAYVREATFWGIPGIALSQPKDGKAGPCDADHLARLIGTLWDRRAVWTGRRAHFLSVNLPERLPAPIVQAAPGTDKIASALCRLESERDGAIRYRLARGRPGHARDGDQNAAVQAGRIAVTRFTALADAPLPRRRFSALL
jgi:5'-nucleotidase